jgi:hypothetical protein
MQHPPAIPVPGNLRCCQKRPLKLP